MINIRIVKRLRILFNKNEYVWFFFKDFWRENIIFIKLFEVIEIWNV